MKLSSTNPEFWARWLGIVLIDLTLAGDNALVIALAVRRLPPKQQFWGRMWGTFGAVALRIGFMMIVSWLLEIPLLQLVGGLALIWIALRLVRPQIEEVEVKARHVVARGDRDHHPRGCGDESGQCHRDFRGVGRGT